MKLRLFALTGLASCVLCTLALAQIRVERAQTEAAPARATVTPSRIQASPAEPVDSVVDELQGIVVLCATDADSDELRTQWSAYVEKHEVPADELDALITTVLRRAEALRAEQDDAPRARRLAADTDATRRMLHDTAMAVIRKIG